MSLTPPVTSAPRSDDEPAARALAAVLLRRLRWTARSLLGLLVAAWSLLLIAWLTLHWGILPHIEQWREPIAARASKALGVTVRIGGIAVRSSGWVPSFELRDVRLLDARQAEALRLPRVFAAVSPRSLLSFSPRFEQLLIDGPQIDLRRDADGRISIAGLDFGGGARGAEADGDAAADWFFGQGEFVIRGGTLRWTDALHAGEPLELRDVSLVVRNGLRSHALRLDATPPPEWGERFSARGRFTQPLLARAGDWRRWSGQAYVSLPHADVRELRRHVSLPFELGEGDGALRGWFDVEAGEPRGATVDVALRAVSLRLAAQVQPLAVEEVEGRLIAQRTPESLTLEARHFGFATLQGAAQVAAPAASAASAAPATAAAASAAASSPAAQRWPRGDMKLVLRQRGDAPVEGGAFDAERLDLGLMAGIASRIPLGDALRRLLAEVDPRGTVGNLSARWDGPIDAPRRYAAKAQLDGLALASHPAAQSGDVGRPGLRNASIQLDATEAGGQARVEIRDGALDLPGVFDEPLLPLERFAAQVSWKIEPAAASSARGAAAQPAAAASAPLAPPPRIAVQVRDARFANADMQGEFRAGWSTGAGDAQAHGSRGARYPGRLELEGRLSSAEAARVARYLPLGIPAETREYVRHAVRGGKVDGVSFTVKGDLAEFPFRNARGGADGEFRIAAKLDDVGFAFVPDRPASGAEPAYVSPWPALARVGGELVFDRASMEIRNAHAQLGGVAWSGVQGGIRSFSEHSVLTLDGTASGPLAEMVKTVNASPVGGWIDDVLAAASASGAATLRLGLSIPLEHASATAVKGSLALAGNDLRFAPDQPLLAGAKGRVDFTHKGFSVVGASARVLGGDAAFEGGTQPDGSVRFTGQGTAGAEGLRRAGELGPLARLAGMLQGQAAYRGSLRFVHGRPEVDLSSSLVGLASSLPAPLGKPAETPLPLHVQTVVEPGAGGGNAARDTLRIELGSVVQAVYQRSLGEGAPEVLRGAIGVNGAAVPPASGVAAHVALATLDTDAWEAVLDKLGGGAASSPFGTAPAGASGAEAREGRDAREPAAPNPYLPDAIALRVQELVIGPRRITGVVAGISNEGNLWRANVDADQLSGYVEYRAPMRRGAGRVHARLARLSLPKSDAEQVETLLEQRSASLPALDVVVDDFELRGKHLGRLEIDAVNHGGREGAREWQLTKLNLSTPEAQLAATGNWGATGPSAAGRVAPRRAVMDFRLQLADGGAWLDRLGTKGAIRGGKGLLSGQISWTGSPFSLDYPSLAGQVKVAIDAGQFLKAEPGAARLLGVLSLQSLPRRLSLDFRDLFQQGFAFDNVTGDVSIEQGVARTNNLRMRGVQALVLMEGSADIEHETQDLRVVVVPEINAGTAALAYAVINPAVGLGAFLAQTLLRKPLAQAGTREFHVSGSWEDPKVEQVPRRFGDDAASPKEAAPAASAATSGAPRNP